jgi:hypothetical protein
VPVFPSTEWLQQVADITAADDEYRKYGRCDAIVGLRFGEQLFSVTFDIFDIKDIHATTEEELRDADFVLEMSPGQWADLITNIAENGKADREHTLNSLDLRLPEGLARNTMGDGYRLDKFFRFNQSLQCFFDNSSRVETTAFAGVDGVGAAAGT